MKEFKNAIRNKQDYIMEDYATYEDAVGWMKSMLVLTLFSKIISTL